MMRACSTRSLELSLPQRPLLAVAPQPPCATYPMTQILATTGDLSDMDTPDCDDDDDDDDAAYPLCHTNTLCTCHSMYFHVTPDATHPLHDLHVLLISP